MNPNWSCHWGSKLWYSSSHFLCPVGPFVSIASFSKPCYSPLFSSCPPLPSWLRSFTAGGIISVGSWLAFSVPVFPSSPIVSQQGTWYCGWDGSSFSRTPVHCRVSASLISTVESQKCPHSQGTNKNAKHNSEDLGHGSTPSRHTPPCCWSSQSAA